MSAPAAEAPRVLVVRAAGRTCAIPLGRVRETMRPQPLHALAGVPGFVAGVAVVRGEPLAVVDLCAFFGVAPAAPSARRFVVLDLSASGARRVVLAVEEVVGVRPAPGGMVELPPLLRGAAGEAVSALGMLDEELLFVLREARLVPEEVWRAVDASARA